MARLLQGALYPEEFLLLERALWVWRTWGAHRMGHAVVLLAGILACGSSSVGATAPHKHGP